MDWSFLAVGHGHRVLLRVNAGGCTTLNELDGEFFEVCRASAALNSPVHHQSFRLNKLESLSTTSRMNEMLFLKVWEAYLNHYRVFSRENLLRGRIEAVRGRLKRKVV